MCEQQLAWVLMEDISSHYFKDKILFGDDFQQFREDGHLPTEGLGTVHLPIFDGDRPVRLALKNVRFAPCSTFNVVSWKLLADMGLHRVEDEDGNWIIFKKGGDKPIFCCSKPSGSDCAFQWIWVRRGKKDIERLKLGRTTGAEAQT